jgi:hypothetical protein
MRIVTFAGEGGGRERESAREHHTRRKVAGVEIGRRLIEKNRGSTQRTIVRSLL